MKLLSLAAIALVLLSTNTVADDEAVVTLTDANFDEFIQNNPRVLVEFYAPWCGHCKQLAPEYEKAAQQLKDGESQTVLAKVDATEEKTVAGKYEIKGFPTLKYFTGDVDAPSEYGGGRQTDTIVSWIQKREAPAVSELESAEDAEAFKSKDKVVVIGYFAKGGDEETVLKSVADKLRDEIVTGQVADESVASSVGATYPSLVLYTTTGSDTKQAVFEGDLTSSEAVEEFIGQERFPLIDQIGPDNYQAYMSRGLPMLWVPLAASDEDAQSSAFGILEPYAAKLKGKVSFVWIDSVQYAQYVESLGVGDGAFIVIESDQATKYKFDSALDASEELEAFFSGYADGTLEKFLKSEPIPENNDESVFVLVGKNFDEVVGQDKDVFVEFYAPWCGHCKKLAPEYEKVGDAFKDVDDVVIAKLDATQNDTPEQIQGFPTLIFYPRGTTTGVKFEGDRSAPAIVEWLKEQSSADTDAVTHDEL